MEFCSDNVTNDAVLSGCTRANRFL
jgi:hypothetical protein